MPPLPTYTSSQCHQIYDRINLPAEYRYEPGTDSRSAATNPSDLAYLTALQQAFLVNIPFENLELHYSAHKTISIDPSIIFDKIVTQDTGRGGYCMENNMLFATFLRSLGFKIYMAGAKVSDANQPTSTKSERDDVGFTGFGHQVTIVTIDGERYLVDVGFGNGGPTTPMLLRDGAESERMPPGQKARMAYVTRPGAESAEAAKVWMYERTIPGKEEAGWLPGYCFPDGVEFTMADFGVMNHTTSTARTSFFTYSVICSKFMAGEGDDGGILGHVTLFGNNVKVERRGKKETVMEIGTEEERVAALKDWLGVRLSEVQRGGIKGMVSALPS